MTEQEFKAKFEKWQNRGLFARSRDKIAIILQGVIWKLFGKKSSHAVELEGRGTKCNCYYFRGKIYTTKLKHYNI